MKHFALLLIAVTALLSGCSTAPVAINEKSFLAAENGRKQSVEPRADACPVRLQGFQDGRTHKTSLGGVAGRTLEAENFPAMVEQGFAYRLREYASVRLLPGDDAVTPAVNVRGEIMKAYMKSVATSMVANVVMRISFGLPDGEQNVITVRGKDTSVNWANGDNEMQRSLSLALIDAVEKAQPALATQCFRLQKMSAAEDTYLR